MNAFWYISNSNPVQSLPSEVQRLIDYDFENNESIEAENQTAGNMYISRTGEVNEEQKR